MQGNPRSSLVPPLKGVTPLGRISGKDLGLDDLGTPLTVPIALGCTLFFPPLWHLHAQNYDYSSVPSRL